MTRYTPGTSPREAAPRASSTGVTFGLSPRYGLHTARDAHEWFIGLVRGAGRVRGRDGESYPCRSGVRPCGGWWWNSGG